jgi:hypothetical protein
LRTKSKFRSLTTLQTKSGRKGDDEDHYWNGKDFGCRRSYQGCPVPLKFALQESQFCGVGLQPRPLKARKMPVFFKLDRLTTLYFDIELQTFLNQMHHKTWILDPIPGRPIILAPMGAARVGLADCGLSLVATAWEKMSTAWEVSNQRILMRRYAPSRHTPKGCDAVARTPTNLLDLHPVDIIVTNRWQPSKGTRSIESDWFRLLKHTASKNLPRVVLELCSPAALVQHDGGREKGLRKRMLAMGYYQRCALVRNTDEGGAVSSDRLVTAYPGSLLTRLPGIHPCEAIGRAISPLFQASTDGPPSPPDD